MYVQDHPSDSPFLYEAEGRLNEKGIVQNAPVINNELEWLRKVITLRIQENDGLIASGSLQSDS